MIFQIENFREAGAGELIFLPAAVRTLRGPQEVDARGHGFAAAFPGRQQGQQGPGRLRRRRLALAGQGRVVVAAATFAPAAARLLHLLEPGDGPAHHRLVHVEADAAQARENLPGAVDVIDAPAAEPGPRRLLGPAQESDGLFHLGMADPVAVMPERFQHARGDVRAARVEHGIVVGERNLGQDFAVDVPIERRPAAVLVLHAQKPLQAALDGGRQVGRLFAADEGVASLGQGGQHHGRVVHIRVMGVAILEEPAALRQIRIHLAPVAAAPDFLVEKPFHRAPNRRMLSRDAGVRQGDQGQGGIPDRRKAGLHAERVVFLDFQLVELLHGPAHFRRLVGVAQAAQADDRVNHGRKDRAHAVAFREMVEEPFLRAAQGKQPHQGQGPQIERRPGGAGRCRSFAILPGVELLQDPVEREEGVGPRNQALAGRVRPLRQIGRPLEKLADIERFGKLAHGLVRVEDAERDDDGARPARHRVNVEIGPAGQQHHLRRHGRAIAVRDLSQQGEIEFGETVAVFRAAQAADDRASAAHGRLGWPVAGQLEREIGFDGNADVGRPVGVAAPAPLGMLLGEQVTSGGSHVPIAFAAQKRFEQNKFRLQDRVALEFPDPVSVGVLPGQERASRSFQIRRRGCWRMEFEPRAAGDGPAVLGCKLRSSVHGIPFPHVPWQFLRVKAFPKPR